MKFASLKGKTVKRIVTIALSVMLAFTGLSFSLAGNYLKANAATKWYKMSSYGIKSPEKYNILSVSGNTVIYRKTNFLSEKEDDWKVAKLTGSTVYLTISRKSPYIDWSDDNIYEHIQNVRICKKSSKSALKKHIKKMDSEYTNYGISFKNGKVRAIAYNIEDIPG